MADLNFIKNYIGANLTIVKERSMGAVYLNENENLVVVTTWYHKRYYKPMMVELQTIVKVVECAKSLDLGRIEMENYYASVVHKLHAKSII